MEILSLMAHHTSLVIERIEQTNEMLRESREQTIRSLVKALEVKDQYTWGHSEEVAMYCRLIAEGMGMSDGEANLIVKASIMHDIGKIGVEFSVLNKPGRLTDEKATGEEGAG